MRFLGFLLELSTRRGAAWAVIGAFLLVVLVVAALAGHPASLAPASTNTTGTVAPMPDLTGELVSVAVPVLQARFPAAQIVVAGGSVPDPSTVYVGTTYPAAGALSANAGVITLYPAAPTPITTEVPTPTTTVDTPAPVDTGSDSSSPDGGGVYVPHPHAHVCVGGRHVHVCS